MQIAPDLNRFAKVTSSTFKENNTIEDLLINVVAFHRKDTSLTSHAILLVIVSCAVCFLRILSLYFRPSTLNVVLLIFASTFVIGLGWFKFCCKLLTARWSADDRVRCVKYLEFMENIWFLSFDIFLLLEILSVTVVVSQCERHDINTTHFTACDSDSQTELPGALLTLIFLAPMLVSVVVKTLRSDVVLWVWAFNFIFVVCVIAIKFGDSALNVIVLAPMSLFILWEYHRQKLSMFLQSQELQGVESEKKKLETELEANELKHLIGNVAHDLKTVSLRRSSMYILCF